MWRYESVVLIVIADLSGVTGVLLEKLSLSTVNLVVRDLQTAAGKHGSSSYADDTLNGLKCNHGRYDAVLQGVHIGEGKDFHGVSHSGSKPVVVE